MVNLPITTGYYFDELAAYYMYLTTDRQYIAKINCDVPPYPITVSENLIEFTKNEIGISFLYVPIEGNEYIVRKIDVVKSLDDILLLFDINPPVCELGKQGTLRSCPWNENLFVIKSDRVSSTFHRAINDPCEHGNKCHFTLCDKYKLKTGITSLAPLPQRSKDVINEKEILSKLRSWNEITPVNVQSNQDNGKSQLVVLKEVYESTNTQEELTELTLDNQDLQEGVKGDDIRNVVKSARLLPVTESWDGLENSKKYDTPNIKQIDFKNTTNLRTWFKGKDQAQWEELANKLNVASLLPIEYVNVRDALIDVALDAFVSS